MTNDDLQKKLLAFIEEEKEKTTGIGITLITVVSLYHLCVLYWVMQLQ